MPESPEIPDNFVPALSPSADAESPASALRDRRGAALSALAYLLFFQITPCAFMMTAYLSITLSTLISLCLTLLCVVFAARAMRSPKILTTAGGAAGLLVLPSLLVAQIAPRFPNWWVWRTFGPPLGVYFQSC